MCSLPSLGHGEPLLVSVGRGLRPLPQNGIRRWRGCLHPISQLSHLEQVYFLSMRAWCMCNSWLESKEMSWQGMPHSESPSPPHMMGPFGRLVQEAAEAAAVSKFVTAASQERRHGIQVRQERDCFCSRLGACGCCYVLSLLLDIM